MISRRQFKCKENIVQMKRRNFIRLSALAGLLAGAKELKALSPQKAGQSKEIYEWRIYNLTGDATVLDNFYEKALIPALEKHHVRVGAFKQFKEEAERKQYYLLVYPSIDIFHKVQKSLWVDETFRTTAQGYFDLTAPNPVYSNFETYLSEAFDRIPKILTPEKYSTLYELRIYHSPNEDANRRKVRMFNVEEIDLFHNKGIKSVCYGDILAGPSMPALMYLTWNKDLASREEVWKVFGSSDEWKVMSKKPEYAYTATKVVSVFLTPLAYSQI